MTEPKSLPPKPILYLRALTFWLGFTLSTILIATAVVLVFALPYRLRYWVATRWTKFNVWWLELTCDLHFRVEGREHIDQVSDAAVIMSKHQSTWETIFLETIFPPTVWVLKRQLTWIPFFGWGLALTDPIAINRSAGRKAMAQLLEQGKERLERGLWVVIFPEGTRVAPGTTKRYKLGGAVLSAETGYPVVPVAHNSGDFWPRHSFIKKPGTITVSIGPPIETRGKKPDQVNNEVQAWIEDKMREISVAAPDSPHGDAGEAQRGVRGEG